MNNIKEEKNFYTKDLIELLNEKKNTNILVTGATGFLGSNYVFWRLRQGGKVFVLVRGDDVQVARKRVLDALIICSSAYDIPLPENLDANLEIILGDVSQHNSGVTGTDIEKLNQASIAEFWHCAASLKFEDKDRDDLLEHNVNGVQNVLQLFKLINAQKYIHISTAYVSGNVIGNVKEELDLNSNSFNNAYEETKKLGEIQVVNCCNELEIDYCILRPSIIIGPYSTRRSGGTRFGVYGFMKEALKLKSVLFDIKTPLRLEGDVNALANLISVDQVVYDMIYLSDIHFGEQKIYHLSNTDLKIGILLAAIDKKLDLGCLSLVDQRDSEQSQFEKLFASRSKFYAGYYRTNKVFNRSLPKHKEISYTDFESYMSSYFKELKNEKSGVVFKKHFINSADNEKLMVSTLGNQENPPIVLINAYGMSSDFMIPMASNLEQRGYFVITWDTRWVPVLTHEFNVEKCNSLTHANDLSDILDHFNIDKVPLVSWSSGAQIALRFMSHYPEKVISSVLMNAGTSLAINNSSRKLTDFEKNIHVLFPMIAKDRKIAKKYCEVVFGSAGSLEDKQMVGMLLGSIDPYLLHLTSAPFRNVESLFRYANMMEQLFKEDDEAWTSNIETPVLIYVGENDRVIHPDIGQELVKRLKSAELIVDPDGEHFAHYYDQYVYNMIDNFVQKNQKYELLPL